MKKIVPFLLAFSMGISVFGVAQSSAPKVLIFSKTLRYYHESIPSGIAAITKLGQVNGFDVDTTKNADFFTDNTLKKYAAIIWLSTTGDVLNPSQQAAFERYIQAGGGYVGIHSASASEKDWEWFGQLTGAVFVNHPPDPVDGIVQVADAKDPSTRHLPKRWKRKDEWYNFKKRMTDVHVLLTADESTYQVAPKARITRLPGSIHSMVAGRFIRRLVTSTKPTMTLCFRSIFWPEFSIASAKTIHSITQKLKRHRCRKRARHLITYIDYRDQIAVKN